MGSLTANESFREHILFLNMKNLLRSGPRWPHSCYGPERDQCNLIPEAIDSYEPILFKESKSYSMIV